jgi:hypothetical protein
MQISINDRKMAIGKGPAIQVQWLLTWQSLAIRR